MSRTAWLAACLAIAPLALVAQPLAPETAVRPIGRAGTTAPETPAAEAPTAPAQVAVMPGQPRVVARPRARLAETPAPAAAPVPETAIAGASPEAVATVPRPEERPGPRSSLSASLAGAQVVSAPVTHAAPPAESTSALCDIAGLEGARIAPVNGAGACGIAAPVKITAVHGVRIAPAAVVDCETARALGAWVGQAAKPMLSATGGGLAVLRTAGSYVCRSRNNEQGAQLSEHAFGRAIDITSFGLRDGREISLTSGWDSSGAGGALRDLHEAACGPFGTVLGPDANAAHRDHFHFDTASNRSPYCR